MYKYTISFFLVLFALQAYSQADKTGNIFEKLTTEVKQFRLDTSNAPDDRVTRKIKSIRDLRGGFNINEVIQFKIEEDRQKNEVPEKDLAALSTFFTLGNGLKWLNNAVIWIYRDHFTFNELKKIERFYRSSAGRKMADQFPVIMVKSLRAAELITEMFRASAQKE